MVQFNHHFTNTTGATVKAVLQAGMDVSCGFYMHDYLPPALKNGDIGMADVDRALTHLMGVKFRLGTFDQELGAAGNPYTTIPGSAINSTAHQNLARSAAEQGLVLLENAATAAGCGVLPLRRAAVRSVAAIGPQRANDNMMQGNYAHLPGALMAGPTKGLQDYDAALAVRTADGCDMRDPDQSGFAAAEKAAAASDATVLFLGIDGDVEGEGLDRVDIALPDVQVQLAKAVVAAAKGKPVVAVVFSGGSLDLSKLTALLPVGLGAVLWAGYPGELGGAALARTLFGDVVPAGRLTTTWHTQAALKNMDFLRMDMRPDTAGGSYPGRTYRFYTGGAQGIEYPFGYGESSRAVSELC